MKVHKIAALEQEVREARERFQKTSRAAQESCTAYNRLKAKTNELRETWLGLCGVLKVHNTKHFGHLTGLILLKQRVRNEYRDVRVASFRILRESCELLAKANSLYRDYQMRNKHLRKVKEANSCSFY